jgi:hypothetical protein
MTSYKTWIEIMRDLNLDVSDSQLYLKDPGLVAATGEAIYDDDIALKLDVGAALVVGNVIIDVSAIEIDDDDELYKICLQGSLTDDFSENIVDLAILELGAKEVLGGDTDSETGRYLLPFRNEQNGVVYPYLRIYTVVSGTVTSGINFSARLGK